MGWARGCESSAPNYNSQEAPGAHSPRDVTAAEGAGGEARPAPSTVGLFRSDPGPGSGPAVRGATREDHAAKALHHATAASAFALDRWSAHGGRGWGGGRHLPYGGDAGRTK